MNSGGRPSIRNLPCLIGSQRIDNGTGDRLARSLARGPSPRALWPEKWSVRTTPRVSTDLGRSAADRPEPVDSHGSSLHLDVLRSDVFSRDSQRDQAIAADSGDPKSSFGIRHNFGYQASHAEIFPAGDIFGAVPRNGFPDAVSPYER